MSSHPFLQGRRCISSLSLGKHPSYLLDDKIRCAATAGFSAIEIAFRDFRHFAQNKGLTDADAAHKINRLCQESRISILSLIAYCYFEGNLSIPLEERLNDFQIWLSIARTLGADFIQIPSQFLPGSTGNENVVVNELRTVADAASQGGSIVNIAYEPVAFATHNATWQDALRLARRINRKNFKICLDSFHIHALLWGDPTSPGGRAPDGDIALLRSIQELTTTLPKDIVAYVQISDAKLFEPPLVKDDPIFQTLESTDPRLYWSRTARPFPGDSSGYFPVVDFLDVILHEWGWMGWVSMEVFPEISDTLECSPDAMAARAKLSIEGLAARMRP